jgi:SAM-dependent methyltransferase
MAAMPEEGVRLECPSCHATAKWLVRCPACGFAVPSLDMFEAWAPELAQLEDERFFDSARFEDLANVEDSNFWFLARNELILWALQKYFDVPGRFAEVGCGTGFVLRSIERQFPLTAIVGTELFLEGLKFAAQRCRRATLVQLDARAIPYRDHFDVVGIFDVLEHIEEDEVVLTQIRKSLVYRGGLLVTVPQLHWLWSPIDEAARHVRRYTAEELESKVTAAGFEILRSTSFVSLLLPAMAADRLKSRRQATSAGVQLRINRYLNYVFRQIMAVEFQLIRRGVNFALGGSRLLVARKTAE